ncbi:hypothetical protein GCK72_025461 [Caenorhabditis remanei]|uniref:Uncharacterized protein n=1 Tax=Caenorhabditis remanei TaxID=31234 RepID=A0A6A5G2Y2_CAERE|nr:hypothetical protein GCK72_025461 [Caenorhabditis remanei]KAF1748994.1 hypothetical protein GCK72_025461 [Caenorhabditis remanei]
MALGSQPTVTRTRPNIINDYYHHDSFKELLQKNEQDVPNLVPKITEINKLMEIRPCGRKGNGVVALQDIPPKTYLRTYYGEITTVKEKARKMKLGEMSLDKETKFYTF